MLPSAFSQATRAASRRALRQLLYGTAIPIVLAGCSEHPAGLLQRASPSIVSQALDGAEVGALDRFQLSIRASGAFRPGLPINVTADALVNLPTDGVQLRITVPEMELARLSSWSEGFSLRLNYGLPAMLETQPTTMGAGAGLDRTGVVTPLAPGYYRVVATIRSAVPQPLAYEGR